MKVYRCDRCGCDKKDISFCIDQFFDTPIKIFNFDVCSVCKKIINKKIADYLKERVKLDRDFVDNLLKI